MGYGMKALKTATRLLNEYEKAERVAERERQKEYKQALKTQKELEKSLMGLRKMLAEHRDYIFEKDPQSKLENKMRMEAKLKDYAFWQFFALQADKEDAYTSIDIEKEKKAFLDNNWKAEWRVEK